MKIERKFSVAASHEQVREVLADEATLLGLFPEAETEVIERGDERITLHARFRALGRDNEVTFHFSWDDAGDVAFEKVCDGNVWKQLRGGVTASEGASGTRLRIHMDGRTKTFVPEITIKIPMEMQLDEMASALRARLESTQ